MLDSRLLACEEVDFDDMLDSRAYDLSYSTGTDTYISKIHRSFHILSKSHPGVIQKSLNVKMKKASFFSAWSLAT